MGGGRAIFGSAGGAMKILVLDDSSARATLIYALEQRGFFVILATSVREAIVLAFEHRPDAAIVETFIGEQPGEEVIRMLLGIHPAMKIVVYSEYNDTASIVEAMHLGAKSVLDKPQPIEEILHAIDPK